MEVLSFVELPVGKRLFATTLNETAAAENGRLGKRGRNLMEEYVMEDEIVKEYLYSV